MVYMVSGFSTGPRFDILGTRNQNQNSAFLQNIS